MAGRSWVIEPHEEVPIRMGSTEPANWEPKTVVQVLKECVRQFPDRGAMHLKRPQPGQKPEEMEWQVWTWTDYLRDVRRFAKSLIALDVDGFRIINIIGFNSPEWFIANVGAIYAGCIAAGIYTTNTADACKYISEHSRAAVVVLEGNKQLEKYARTANVLRDHLRCIVVWGEDPAPDLVNACGIPVHSWEQFLEIGNGVDEDVLEARAAVPKPGNCSTLIYTSGTTGPPKAVMISHDNITWTTRNVLQRTFPFLNETDRCISYLPLSHIAAQIIDIHGSMGQGYGIYFAQPDALKGSLGKTMVEVRPTLFFGVPRVWEKIYEKMQEIAARTTGIKRDLGRWAKGLGSGKAEMHQFGNRGGSPCGFGCANSLVLNKIKQALGLDQAKACWTAAAPISVEVINYFASLDIYLLEVFGQSECTGPHTVSVPDGWRIGYCGRPMEGTESMLVPENGELCYRGRHIFMGYMYMADKTAETIDDEGWLHSGDVGEFDNNNHPNVAPPSGFLKITGRIKELIITAGGENIPPVLIEQEMKSAMPAIANCMVVGDRRKFLIILLTLMVDVDEHGVPGNNLAGASLETSRRIGSSATTTQEAQTCPQWKNYFDSGVKLANSRTTSRAQVVQKWGLLDTDFSEKGGELTPTLKLKRNVASSKHQDAIERLYAGADD